MDNNQSEFIKIGSFIDVFQANMAREILQSNGISCVVTEMNSGYLIFIKDNIPVHLS